MVRKIESNEYLKRYDNMDAAERTVYLNRVGEWLGGGAKVIAGRVGENFNARLQNVMTISAEWNDAECGAFEEGAKLLTALVARCETWLPDMLYAKAVGRCVRQMVKCLTQIQNAKSLNESSGKADYKIQNGVSDTPKPSEAPMPEKRKRGRPRKQELPSITGDWVQKGVTGCYSDPTKGSKSLTCDGGKDGGGSVPVRPRHIDQYVHLLPEATQKKAATVKQLLTDLDRARENARLLMDDKQAHPDDIAKWARMATSCDNKVKAIYKELDREWAKLVKSGRVVVDDLGNARIQPPSDSPEGEESQGVQSTPKDQNKRRLLRKWLVDTRRGNGATREEHVRKWEETFAEYLTIEGDAAYKDEKIQKAAEHYNVHLDELRIKN